MRLLFIVGLLTSQLAYAANQEGEYTISGTESCGKFLSANYQEKVYFDGWLKGFLSAYNQYEHDGVNIAFSTDFESIDIWLHQYCQENPLNRHYQAVQALIDTLKSN